MVFVFFSTYKVFSHHSFPQKLVPFWKGTTSWAEGNNFPHSDDNITFHFESACHLSLCMSSEKSVLPTLPLLCVMKVFLQLGFKCQIYQSCKLNELSTKVMKIANWQNFHQLAILTKRRRIYNSENVPLSFSTKHNFFHVRSLDRVLCTIVVNNHLEIDYF